VELSHVIGDAHAFYTVYGMLQPGAKVVALNPERKEDFAKLAQHFHGGFDHTFTPNIRRGIKPVLGSLHTFCKSVDQPPSLLLVDSKWVAQQKADAPACSTNDILTSMLLRKSSACYGIMPVNLRNRILDVSCSDAGNYWRPQEILEDEFQTPLGVRGVVRIATAGSEKSAEQKSNPRRPSLRQVGRIGVVTNWTTFYRDLDLPGCTQLMHIPLMNNEQPAIAGFVIFRPAKDQIAVWCSDRDTRVMQSLGELPMFCGPVGMPA